MEIVSELLKNVTTIVGVAIPKNISAISSAISPVFLAFIGLYVCFIAYSIIYSQRDVVMQEVTKTIMSFAVVAAFTYSGNYYAQYVVPFVMNAGGDLSGALTGNSDVASTIDSLWNQLTTSLDTYWDTAVSLLKWNDFGGWLKTGVIYAIGYLGGAILVLYSALFLCVSTFMVGILLSVGVIFISFAVFPSTRSMFTAWCGHCLNYVLLNVFYTISFGFTIGFIEKYSKLNPASVTLMDVATLAIVIAVSVFLIEQIGTLCSSLTGGVGINGLTGAANGAASLAYRASGMRAMAGGARSLAGKAGGKAKDYVKSKLGKGSIKGG
ncbi:MAG: type IV secretion system protein [Plesiomonas shigelloides]